jgi:membrane-associated phospholipid phosphatase
VSGPLTCCSRWGRWAGAVLLLMGSVSAQPAEAQEGAAGMDQSLLAWVNGSDSRVLRHALGAADYSAYPVFYGAIPVAWGVALVSGDDQGTAGRITASMIGAFGAAAVLKRLAGRSRPNVTHPWVRSRPEFPGGRNLDPGSWPSGHAALAAALVTSLSLSHPKAWIIAPGVVWAVAVGLSRVWLGVHYPSDVLTGWAIGAAVAWTVNSMGNNRRFGTFEGGPVLRWSIPLG